jgi:hypothetical protein
MKSIHYKNYKPGDMVYYDSLISTKRIYGVVIETDSRKFKVFWFFHKRAYSYLYSINDSKGATGRITVIE